MKPRIIGRIGPLRGLYPGGPESDRDCRETRAEPLGRPRPARHRPADGGARRDDREHRAALRADGRSASRPTAASGSSPPTRWRSAACCCSAGKLGDLFGRKWTFIAGLIGFAVASAIGGAAQTFGVLVAARALQGAFGALLAPSALVAADDRRSPTRPTAPRRSAIFGAIAGGGASVGLLLGGDPHRGALLALVPLRQPRDRAARRHRGAPAPREPRQSRQRPRIDCRARSRSPSASSRWSTGSRTPRPTPGRTRHDLRRSSRAPCCSRPSWPSSAEPRIRCCRCTSSGTAGAGAPTRRSRSPAPACSGCSSSSPSTCSGTSASRRCRPARPSCR